MLPPVKFNMLGPMQLRASGGSSSSSNNTTAVNGCTSPDSKPPSSSKTSTPASSASSSSSSSTSSLSPEDSPTLVVKRSKGKKDRSSSSSDGGSVNVHGNITLAFSPDARRQINSAFAWQLANSSQSIDQQETRSNNQNGCRGAGDGVAVGGLNLNTDVHANHQYPHLLQRKSPASFSFSKTHFQHQQQQHGISNIIGSQHHHQQQENLANDTEVIEDASVDEYSDTEVTIGGSGGESGDKAESPLDFSTKNFKGESKGASETLGSIAIDLAGGCTNTLNRETSESPCSRLRNILSMKSPSIPEDMAGTVLNLSKESPLSIWCKVESQNNNNSNSCSPAHSHSEHSTAFVQSNSPRPATIPLSMAAASTVVPSTVGVLNGSTHSGSTTTMGLPSWGTGVYSPSLSPILNQTVPVTGGTLPITFETSPTLFPHHMTAGASGPGLPFPQSLQMTLPNSNGSSSNSKARITRPFKAYPKDPLSFSSVGLYGLPLGTAPGTDAVILQQSNQAYAEFRQRFVSSSQYSKSKRGGHRHAPYPLPPGTVSDLCSENGSMLRATDSGSDDGGSLSSDKDKGGKTDQQVKDKIYWERRRKNNEAAKRSRDARRAKEDEIAIRAAFLEQENLKLRFEVSALKNETSKLRCMLYSS